MQSVNGSVIMTIASSFGISAALTQTGAVILALHWMFFFAFAEAFYYTRHFNYCHTNFSPFFISLTDPHGNQTPCQSKLQTTLFRGADGCESIYININQ